MTVKETGTDTTGTLDTRQILKTLTAFKNGDFSARMPAALSGMTEQQPVRRLRRNPASHEQCCSREPK
jgi:hypothetical protein